MDNYWKTCPAVMSDARIFTDYRSSTTREHYNRTINGIVRDDDYRIFLQTNAEKIIDNEWNYNKTNNSCFPNDCIHNYSTRTTSDEHNEEHRVYNAVKSGKQSAKCSNLQDYRMTLNTGTNKLDVHSEKRT
jgi:hypothetical protein